jgi:hypothetical protein
MPPTALIDSLRNVRVRVRRLSLLRGFGFVVSSIAGLLLAVVLLDYFLNLAPIPRIVVMLAAAVMVVMAIVRWIARPAAARMGLTEIAARLEEAFPQFDDRLRSAVDFSSQSSPGSRVMQDRVMIQAAELAEQTDLTSAIVTKPVWYSLAGAGGSLVALALIALLMGSEYLSPAMSRLLTPFHAQPWPKRVQIAMDGQLPDRVPAGRQIDVRLHLVKGDKPSRQAELCWDWGDGRVEKELMTRGADGVYAATLDAHGQGTMHVWTESGDDATAARTISVVEPMGIKSVELLVTPPPYTKQPATTLELDSAAATVTYGSTLSLIATFNKNIDPAHPLNVLPGQGQSKTPTINWQPAAGDAATGNWIARNTVAFALRAFDTDGFPNNDASEYQVIVRPDQPPDVQITYPEHNEECTPQAIVPIRAIAEDDFGVSSLRLVVMRLGDNPQSLANIDLVQNAVPTNGATWTALESTGEMRRWQVEYPWDLSKIQPPLKSGDMIEYHLEVTDNFSFEGNTHPPVSSSRFRISIVSQEQFASLMGDLVAQVRQQVVDVRNSQRAMKEETGDLQKQVAGEKKFTLADRAQAEALVATQTTAASQTRSASERLADLVRRMDENKSTAQDLRSMSADVRDALADVAEHPMKAAASKIDDAKDLTGDDSKIASARSTDLDAAQDQQEEAARKLDEAASRMGEAGGLPKEIEQLQEILAEQNRISHASDELGLRNLGKTPDQLSDPDRAQQQKNAADQDLLADKTDKAIDQLNSLANRLQKTDPASSQAMQQAAKSGQQQSVASQMRQSSQAQRQNQQSAAQQSQSQAEVGLQMMIRQLEEAQRHKLEELSRQLADMKDQIQSLIRQQAELNYQNLELRQGDVLAKTDPKVLDDLLDKAQWTRGHEPPVPDLDTQSRLQEQNERNARSVGKQAETLPDGSALEVGLDRAAQQMSRAISFLRDDSQTDTDRLAAAYEPPQIEALAALVKTADTLAEQMRKNDEKLNQQKKDSLRVAYEKILVAQKKIDADTKSLDQSPRTPDGQLGHRDEIRLRQLPGEQNDLADSTAKLQSDLSALGGIVYVWANNDIVDAMRDVQADLGIPKTDAVTQSEQQRIEDQLQAMIESLKVKPKQSQFTQGHNNAGGKGGSGGAPPLPPEAELRLLKRLQQAINKSTVTLSSQPTPPDAKLIALGQRQGELRTLLAQLLDKATKGQVALGPEADPKQKLPEEASDEDIDNQELEHVLLNGDGQPDPDQVKNDVALVGQRMSRSHQRLANDHDPGQTTQKIQKRILDNLDSLIEMARAEQSEPKPGQGQPSQATDPTAGLQPDNQASHQPPQSVGGSTPAATATNNRDVNTTGTPTTDITQTLKEWGALSPRKRAAVIEAATEKPIEKFRGLIDDYYKALGTRTGE